MGNLVACDGRFAAAGLSTSSRVTGSSRQVMLILDDTSIAVDAVTPPSAATLPAALVEAWPRLAGRTRCVSSPLDVVDILPADMVVSVHACGALTDLARAQAVRVLASRSRRRRVRYRRAHRMDGRCARD